MKMMKKDRGVFNNKFDNKLLVYFINLIMDFFKELIELNNKIELTKLSLEYLEIDSDDDDEDIEFIQKQREIFINDYNKNNFRLFKLKKN